MPLRDRKYKCSTVKEPQLKVCPCCQLEDEDPMHFLHCQHNTIAQTPALVFFLKASILKGPHPSRPASVRCMHRKFPSEFTLAVNPRFQHYHLTCERTIIWRSKRRLSSDGCQHYKVGIPSSQLYLSSITTRLKWEKVAPTKHCWWLHFYHGPYGLDEMKPCMRKKKRRTVWCSYPADSAEMRHYHTHPQQLPRSDRRYCSSTLSTLIQTRPSVQRWWLQRGVRTARAVFQ